MGGVIRSALDLGPLGTCTTNSVIYALFGKISVLIKRRQRLTDLSEHYTPLSWAVESWQRK